MVSKPTTVKETFIFDRSTKHKHRFTAMGDSHRENHEKFGTLYVPKAWFSNPQELEVIIKHTK